MLGYIGVEVPGLKPGEFFSDIFCARFFYFSVTVLLEYLDRAFFTCLVLLYISLDNTHSTFKPQIVLVTS